MAGAQRSHTTIITKTQWPLSGRRIVGDGGKTQGWALQVAGEAGAEGDQGGNADVDDMWFECVVRRMN